MRSARGDWERARTRFEEAYAAFGSFVKRPNLLPSMSSQVANQPILGMAVLSWTILPPEATMVALASSIESTLMVRLVSESLRRWKRAPLMPGSSVTDRA